MSNPKFDIGPEDFMSGAVISPSMLEDLYDVAHLESEQIAKISQVISELDGLSKNEEVESLIDAVLSDDQESSGAKIYKVVKSIDEEDVPKIIELVKAWAQRKEERKNVFPDSLIEKLTSNLKSLVDKSGAIDLIKKADRLVRDTSNELDSFKFVCDLRPVFDDPREKIQALVLLANFRVRFTKQDGTKGSFEIALTEDELNELKKKTEQALSKLNVMKKLSDTLNESVT